MSEIINFMKKLFTFNCNCKCKSSDENTTSKNIHSQKKHSINNKENKINTNNGSYFHNDINDNLLSQVLKEDPFFFS